MRERERGRGSAGEGDERNARVRVFKLSSEVCAGARERLQAGGAHLGGGGRRGAVARAGGEAECLH